MKVAYLLCFVFAASFLVGCTQTEKSEMAFDLLEQEGQHSRTYEKEVMEVFVDERICCCLRANCHHTQ